MAKIQAIEGEEQQQIIKSAQKGMTEAQMKLIRRREYYSRRVKADFAPLNGDEQLNEEDS
jgi:hypothetical protein